MKKLTIAGIVLAGLTLIGFVSGGESTQPAQLDNTQRSSVVDVKKDTPREVAPPTCDGVSVTSACIKDGLSYKAYIYHPAVPEKTRNETVTTYEEKVTGYCTLCNDGTYSPSCATGRGACSHHGGVAQWNAPRTSKIPVTATKKVIESPAVPEYYEKIVEE